MSTPSVVRVHPGPLAGTVRVPGDKSLSHRALLLGALVGTPVTVSGVATSGDAASMAACLRRLGAKVALEPDGDGGLTGEVAGPLHEATDVLDCGNAGTAMRLLAGVVAGIDGLAVLTGDASLRRRPMRRVLDPLAAMGAHVDGRGGGDLPPVVIRGGRLRGIDHASPVASAQVKSALLLAGLAADGPTSVTSPLASRDHTERLLAHLGHPVDTRIEDDGREVVRVVPGALTAADVHVAADPSAAAFWLVAAAIAGTAVTIPDVCVNPGRVGALDVLHRLGAVVERDDERLTAGEPVADLSLRGARLAGSAVVEGRLVVDALDELPILALAGAVADGGMRVRDAAELRVKESDRINALVEVFDAVGLRIAPRDDGFDVPGGQVPRGGGRVDAHGDHRIAMTAAIAATVGAAPVDIAGFAAVPTSYPGFLADLESLGGRIEVLEVEA